MASLAVQHGSSATCFQMVCGVVCLINLMYFSLLAYILPLDGWLDLSFEFG